MKFHARLFIALIVAAVSPCLHAALTADQLALIVNANEPQSLDLANFYAKARNIPDGRIIQLHLPLDDDLTADSYNRDVVVPIRQYLTDHSLRDKVKCLVTFYGLPLRIRDRVNSKPDDAELNDLQEQAKPVMGMIAEVVDSAEKRAAQINPSFHPLAAQKTFEILVKRLQFASQVILSAMQANNDAQQRSQLQAFLLHIRQQLSERYQPNIPVTAATTAPTTQPIAEMMKHPFDPATRGPLRDFVRQNATLFEYATILQGQIDFLTPDSTGSALDNELPMLWQPAYVRAKWLANPLNLNGKPVTDPPVLMVMRLDGPTPQAVRDLIANEIAAERDGLKGVIAIDARGISPKDAGGNIVPLGMYDQHLRDLADLIKAKSQMKVVLDNEPNCFPDNSVDDVALYCGWYSLRHYIPGMKFNRGAVGYHVASFEFLSLHWQLEAGWVRGLLNSGVVGTLGPVAEPYLHSFPKPDDFFPLLMTGKMTLGEVYWTTTPLVSWMQSCVGDPLYNPFLHDPQLKVEDLPQSLQAAVNRN